MGRILFVPAWMSEGRGRGAEGLPIGEVFEVVEAVQVVGSPDGPTCCRLEFLAVLQEMLLLRAGDPVVVPDAIGECVEFRRHVFDVLILPLGDLPEREHPHAIEDALHHRADPVDLFEIVFLGRVTFSCAPFCGGATG